MTKQFFMVSLLVGATLTLQTKRGQAQDVAPMIIKATQVFTPPDNGGDDPNPPQETTIMVYLKGNHIKSESKSDVQHTITLVDKDAKKTTQLYENGGRKYGYYSIDTAAPRPPRLDSTGKPIQRPATNIEYVDSTMTIAGYTCKKAVARTSFGGRNIVTEIWYTTDLPIKAPIQTGGRGFGMGGFNQLKGFPMAFNTAIFNGATIQYKVTKVTLNANINDSDFDVPKGYDVKPESERPQGGFGPGGGRGFRGGDGPPPPGGGGM
jgi:GLPGLI family protein